MVNMKSIWSDKILRRYKPNGEVMSAEGNLRSIDVELTATFRENSVAL